MTYVAVYAYVQPYRKFYVNILETVMLIDILLMLIIASSAQFEVSGYLMYVSVNCTYPGLRMEYLVKMIALKLVSVDMFM